MIFSLEAILSFLIPAAVVAVAEAVGTDSKCTLDNLQAAFNGESNARNMYLAFAAKADEEGYGEVASLFRATAKAEAIHSENHAVVMRKLGAQPKANIVKPEVRSTRENLAVAIDGEKYESEKMYPGFIAQARAAKDSAALRTFTFAVSAEVEHQRLYSEALENLEKLQGSASREYYVCLICGFTVENLNLLHCLVCGAPKSKYLMVR